MLDTIKVNWLTDIEEYRLENFTDLQGSKRQMVPNGTRIYRSRYPK